MMPATEIMSDTGQPRSAPASPPPEWWTVWRFAWLLAALLGIRFWPVLFGDQALFYRDYGFLGYPFVYFHHESFWQGELPFWNPYVNCGAPFLAQWNTLTLYPLSLIYLLFPLPGSLAWFCVAHLFLAGLGMFFLARRWFGNHFAAALAGVGFAFGGVTISSVIYPNYLATLGWLPWVVLLTERAWREGGKLIALAALAGALQMLTGAPEILLLTWLLLLAMMLGQWLPRPAGDARKLPLRFVAVVALVAGLTAAQMLPFFDLLVHSQRHQNYAGGFWSVPAWGWANLFAPLFHAARTPQGTFVQPGQAFFASYYPGVALLGAALLALCHLRQRRLWLLATAALGGFMLAQGSNNFLYDALRMIAAPLGFVRYPAKFIVLTAFVIPLLAAAGIAWLQNLPSDQQRRRNIVILAVSLSTTLLGLTAWFMFSPLPTDVPPEFLKNNAGRLLFASLLLATIHLYTCGQKPRWIAALAPVVLWLDLSTQMPMHLPTIPNWAFTPGLAQDQKLKLTPAPRLGEARVMISPAAEARLHKMMVPDLLQDFIGMRLALWNNLNLLDGLPKVNGASTLQIREQFEVEQMLYASGTNTLEGLSDFLGVSHITAPGEVVSWNKRDAARPWITGGQPPFFLDEAAIIRLLQSTNFNPATMVCLPPAANELRPTIHSATVDISETRFANQRVEFTVAAAAPAMIVVAQTFFHPWQATVDGQPAPVLRANHAFQALPVTTGKHRVVLNYVDKRFQMGAGISLATLAGCGWLLCRNRKNPARP